MSLAHIYGFRLELPPWLTDHLTKTPDRLETPEQRMAFVVELAGRNIREGTGGPFGAAVFRLDTHELVAPGVNLVLSTKCSVAHAEVVALTIAQQRVGSHDLGAPECSHVELVTSCEPCTMCLGAVCWSGVRQIVCGAREADASAIGFDEGPKLPHWVSELKHRGITVVRDIGRREAKQVLQDYAYMGGIIYNSRLRSVVAGTLDKID